MSDVTQLVDRYIAMWNETDAGRRRELIAAIWIAEPSYADPAATGEGRAGIDAMVAAVQARFPGHRFRRTSEVDLHHERLRFRWELAPEGGPTLVAGVDFGTLAEGSRLASITGFFDQVPKAA